MDIFDPVSIDFLVDFFGRPKVKSQNVLLNIKFLVEQLFFNFFGPTSSNFFSIFLARRQKFFTSTSRTRWQPESYRPTALDPRRTDQELSVAQPTDPVVLQP
jgi:hypothetical protein